MWCKSIIFNKFTIHLNKQINNDHKNLATWLGTNKIYFNVKKLEMVVSKSKKK